MHTNQCKIESPRCRRVYRVSANTCQPLPTAPNQHFSPFTAVTRVQIPYALLSFQSTYWLRADKCFFVGHAVVTNAAENGVQLAHCAMTIHRELFRQRGVAANKMAGEKRCSRCSPAHSGEAYSSGIPMSGTQTPPTQTMPAGQM